VSRILFISFLFFIPLIHFGQKDAVSIYEMRTEGQDTVVIVELNEAIIRSEKRSSKRQIRRNKRLLEKVVKVYPYAHLAGELMKDYERELSQISSEREQKMFLKEKESALHAQFEGELKKMTISEGIILIKLIDRETGDTSFGLIQELKGNFSAFMWQSVARLFGHNLKSNYDPHGEDWYIEMIVQEIELGLIPIDSPANHSSYIESHN
jgi:hypothetical protein